MSSIDNLKLGMGWRHPSRRRFCNNCGHGEAHASAPGRLPGWRCTRGGFYTPRYAVCEQWRMRCDVSGARGRP